MSTHPSRLGRWQPTVHCCSEATNMMTFPFRQSPCSPASPLLARKRWTPAQELSVRTIAALLIGNTGAVRIPTCTFLSPVLHATTAHRPVPFWLPSTTEAFSSPAALPTAERQRADHEHQAQPRDSNKPQGCRGHGGQQRHIPCQSVWR